MSKRILISIQILTTRAYAEMAAAIQGVVFTLFLVVILGWGVQQKECSAAESGHVVKTTHTTITFTSLDDVAVLNEAIDFGRNISLSSIFSSSGPTEKENELIRKIDLLFEKVQLLLDMGEEMRDVNIRVYANADELHAAYAKIFNKPGDERAWYVFKYNTVFINVQDVHDGVLAHEMAHAIIDNNLEARLPRASAEILAQYVDRHLRDEVKIY